MGVINAKSPSLVFSAIGPGSTGADLYALAADGALNSNPLGGREDARIVESICAPDGRI